MEGNLLLKRHPSDRDIKSLEVDHSKSGYKNFWTKARPSTLELCDEHCSFIVNPLCPKVEAIRSSTMEDQQLTCGSCRSINVIELATETCLHFRGLSGLNVEPIIVFPKTVICLECGAMQSNLAQSEIEQVREATARLNVASPRHSGSSLH